MNKRAVNFTELMQRNLESVFGLHNMGRDSNIQGFMDLARVCLESEGVNRPERSAQQLLNRALTTSDFPAVLANTASKLLQESFRLQPATYPYWMAPWQVNDFKEHELVRVGYPGDLPEVGEAREYQSLDVAEGSESAALTTRGGMLGFSRHMLINDDLGAFKERAQAGGVIARRTISRRAYNTLLNPGNLSDGNPFFSTTRGNLLEGTSGETLALGADSLGKAVAALRNQTDDKGNYLHFEPKVLAVPPALEITAWNLCLANSLLGQDNSGVPNVFRERFGLIPVVSPELADTGLGGNDQDWYLFADPQVVPASFKMLNLTEGWPEPFVEEQLQFLTDELQAKIRVDFQPAAVNPRGCVKVKVYSG